MNEYILTFIPILDQKNIKINFYKIIYHNFPGGT